MLVHSRDDLRNKYILCLGELHLVFAHIRAIGRFIEQSGMGDAWLEAEWYDSDCIVRQILECGHMKRALDAHEATLVAINIILLKSYLHELYKRKTLKSNKIAKTIKIMQQGLDEDNSILITKAFK